MNSLDISTILNIPELHTYLLRVEQELDFVLDRNIPSIRKPALRVVRARSKRLRSSLVIAVSASQGVDIDQKVIKGCAAIELVHIASLVHDDIIDNANTRWGIPTISSTEGMGPAIVVGDYLLAKAGVTAASISTDVAFTVSSAIASLCDGQSRELSTQHNLNRTLSSYKESVNGKTASLISAAVKVGGLCANLDENRVQHLARFGINFGMAFQIIDDLIDILSIPELSGKPVNNDIKEGVYTLPILISLTGKYKDRVGQLLKNNSINKRDELINILFRDGSFEKSVSSAAKYNTKAKDALNDFGDNSVMNSLRNLPKLYLDWTLENLTEPRYREQILNLLN